MYDNIFAGCLSLKSIKCKDKKILEMFESVKKFVKSLHESEEIKKFRYKLYGYSFLLDSSI